MSASCHASNFTHITLFAGLMSHDINRARGTSSHASPAHSSPYLRRSSAPVFRAAEAPSQRSSLLPPRRGREQRCPSNTHIPPDKPSPRQDETRFCRDCGRGTVDRWVNEWRVFLWQSAASWWAQFRTKDRDTGGLFQLKFVQSDSFLTEVLFFLMQKI